MAMKKSRKLGVKTYEVESFLLASVVFGTMPSLERVVELARAATEYGIWTGDGVANEWHNPGISAWFHFHMDVKVLEGTVSRSRETSDDEQGLPEGTYTKLRDLESTSPIRKDALDILLAYCSARPFYDIFRDLKESYGKRSSEWCYRKREELRAKYPQATQPEGRPGNSPPSGFRTGTSRP
jgi:hypothetical protein